VLKVSAQCHMSPTSYHFYCSEKNTYSHQVTTISDFQCSREHTDTQTQPTSKAILTSLCVAGVQVIKPIICRI